MTKLKLNFARTLEAADKSPGGPTEDAHFPQFSSLPLEIRTSIWENVLPDPAAEPHAIFSQAHCYNFSEYQEIIEPAGNQVPIWMTTTCAALLHVNRESRYLVLKWAELHRYELCYRRFCHSEDYYILDEDEEGYDHYDERLPVQGPIFVRYWDPSKDILHVSSADIDSPPAELAQTYFDGEVLGNVQHVAFSVRNMKHYLGSSWFYWFLVAMPSLKSVSFDYDGLTQMDGETLGGRSIEAGSVGDPWVKETSDGNEPQSLDIDARWEAVDCDAECELDFKKRNFSTKLKQGYSYYWPGDFDTASQASDDTDDDQDTPRRTKVFNELPPWIWNDEKGDFAFEIRIFNMVERRGYNDVRDGLVTTCAHLWGDPPFGL